MACKIDLSSLILQEAQAQGVDPGIALAVARTESGVCHWRPDGSVVTSSAGAIGVMQLEPATAAALGVDPYDLTQNIRGGVTYLKQMYDKYGSWNLALAAYNWGPGNLGKALASAAAIPGEVLNYVKGILGMGAVYNAGLTQIQQSDQSGDVSTADIAASVADTPAMNVDLVACLAIGGVVAAVWWLSD
jgi:soluble lytic murein transglycosylase-like protein